jgi:S1-C subfamily serine protease
MNDERNEVRPGAVPGTPGPRWRRARWLVPGALLLAVATAGGAVVALRETPDATPARTIDVREGAPPPPSSTADLVEQVLPSVVNIRTTGLGTDPFGGTETTSGQGSGVVIDADGVILTNHHVVAGAVEVTVVFNDDEHVQVDADDLTPIAVGSSEGLRLGDEVVALGFPLGLGGPTVTKGIVSGLDRTIEASGAGFTERLSGLIQTDAAVNPGNSGGPLVDAAGRLVGLNTAAASAASAENVGFAIPIDEALPIAEQIVESPAGERAWLGVEVTTVASSAEAGQLGLPLATRGALVQGVVPGGPADEAGIVPGEVIVGIGEQVVASAVELTEVLADLEPEQEVQVRLVSREGARVVSLELGRRPVALVG